MPPLDPWYLEHLVCPRDRGPLKESTLGLTCESGHRYPVVEGMPVMLVEESVPTIDIASRSIAAVRSGDPWQLETLSLSEEERRGIAALIERGSVIDPVVAYLVAATNGLMYRHLIGTLDRYPIPQLPLGDGGGRRLLDVGCSWGRWSLAASERGYDAVGIDPSLGAVLAARRVAAALGRPAHFVVGDARHLPFADGSFDVTYSYSVLQHFSYPDAERAVGELGRVLRLQGIAKVQFPSLFGIRCLYHQARRHFRAAEGFEVRYWTLPRLRRLFASAIGPATIGIDGFFGIGLQATDAALMPPRLARVLALSERLKTIASVVTPLRWAADSVFVESVKAGH